jgi:electron transfer flavoprotein beta subunit
MRIVVCVKQVPDVAELKIDEVTHSLVRAGVPSILNPFDEFAVEEALKIREKIGGTVTVVTMGPPQAKEALFRCLAMGANRAILLTDSAFAASDTWATAKALALAVQKLGFDLIICGMKAIDGETCQVGPELAELLGIPHIAGIKKVEIESPANTVLAEKLTEEGYEQIRSTMPCLLTASKALNVPRMPTIMQLLAAKQKPTETWSAANIGAEREDVGLTGSRTQVLKVYTPELQSQGIIVNTDDIHNVVTQIMRLLEKEGSI